MLNSPSTERSLCWFFFVCDRHDGYQCYKDGPELPPLDFNTNCNTHGRYVIFYNERLYATSYPISYETTAVYTELCEVTVTGILIIYWNCFAIESRIKISIV